MTLCIVPKYPIDNARRSGFESGFAADVCSLLGIQNDRSEEVARRIRGLASVWVRASEQSSSEVAREAEPFARPREVLPVCQEEVDSYLRCIREHPAGLRATASLGGGCAGTQRVAFGRGFTRSIVFQGVFAQFLRFVLVRSCNSIVQSFSSVLRVFVFVTREFGGLIDCILHDCR